MPGHASVSTTEKYYAKFSPQSASRNVAARAPRGETEWQKVPLRSRCDEGS